MCVCEREVYVCICIHVCMPIHCGHLCVKVIMHICAGTCDLYVWRAKVDIRNRCQSLFHFTQWDRAHYYNYTIIVIIISLLFPGSLLWGVLCLPTKAGITGGLSPSFYMSPRDQNIGLHACTASTCTGFLFVCLSTWHKRESLEPREPQLRHFP